MWIIELGYTIYIPRNGMNWYLLVLLCGKFIDIVIYVNLALTVFHFYNNLIIYIFSSVQRLLLKMLRTCSDSYLPSFPKVLGNRFCINLKDLDT